MISKGRGMKFVKYFVVLLTLAIFTAPHYSYGADLSNLSDDLSRLKSGEYANHTIKFKTPSGAGNTDDTIIITFPASFDLSALAISDINLTHGLTGTEIEETLADPANTTDWGVIITENILTFSHPTNSNNGDINKDDIVTIKIGVNANGE